MYSRTVWFLTVCSCLATGCGGSPSAPTEPGPSPGTVFRQGTIEIQQTFAFDLDTGYVPTMLQDGGDVWFNAVTDTDRYLTPMYWDRAALAVWGQTDPGYAGCASAALGQTDVPIQSLSPGLYLCVRTSEDRVAVLRVIEPPGPSARSATIDLGYTVYNK